MRDRVHGVVGRLTSSMAARLLLAFAALILPLVLFAAWSYERARDERRDDALADTVQSALTAAALVQGLLVDLDGTTLAMALALGARPGSLDQASIGPYLAAVAGNYPVVRAIFLTDPTGRVIASQRAEGLGVDLSTRPYTIALLEGREFVLSELIAGTQSGTPTVAMARTVREPEGGLRGLLVVAFYPDRLADLFPEALPADANLTVVDSRGRVIYSSATPNLTWEQRDQSRSPRVQGALAGQVSTADRIISPIDGKARLVAAVPVPEYGWAVSISRTTAAVEGPLRERFREQMIALGVVALAALALALVLARTLSGPLTRLAERARAVGRGERPPPLPASGPAEVRTLARVFDATVAELDARAAENARLFRDAQEALRVRDEFLGSVSHDLRTPLTTMRGMVQMVQRRLARDETLDRERIGQWLAGADGAAEKMVAMIDELLDVTRLETGRPLDLNQGPGDLAALVRQVAEDHQRGTDRHRIVVEAAVGSLPGEWDMARLERVLTNLLSNALKYSPDGGDVVVSLAREAGTDDGDWAVLAVRDSGIGIPAADLPHIFERFHRAANAGRFKGVGIGLAGARAIVEQHGGTMQIASVEGQGTTVSLRLPLASESVAADAPPESDQVVTHSS